MEHPDRPKDGRTLYFAQRLWCFITLSWWTASKLRLDSSPDAGASCGKCKLYFDTAGLLASRATSPSSVKLSQPQMSTNCTATSSPCRKLKMRLQLCQKTGQAVAIDLKSRIPPLRIAGIYPSKEFTRVEMKRPSLPLGTARTSWRNGGRPPVITNLRALACTLYSSTHGGRGLALPLGQDSSGVDSAR